MVFTHFDAPDDDDTDAAAGVAWVELEEFGMIGDGATTDELVDVVGGHK